MPQKHVEHAKAQWAKVDPKIRSLHASKMAKARYAKETPEQRKANAFKAVMARWHPEKVIHNSDLQEKKESI